MKILLLLAMVFMLCCGTDSEQVIRDRTQQQRAKVISKIRTIESTEYYGEYDSSDYNGEDCDDLKRTDKNYRKCKDICEDIYEGERDSCEELPIDLIFKLDILYQKIKRFKTKDNIFNRSVSDFDFGVMIDIHVNSVIELIEDWTTRELAEFLTWVASKPSVALALEEHDEEHEILNAAFTKLARQNDQREIKHGIGIGLEGYNKTFWVTAEKWENEIAFVAMHSFIETICTSSTPATRKNCKLDIYCLREEFDYSRTRQKCNYSSNSRSSRRINHCYIHGPDVWSYWEELNQKDRIQDSDFPSDSSNQQDNFTEDICDHHCEDSHRCRKPI